MTQPNRPQECIIPLLIQEQLSTVSESRIHLAVPIDVRCNHPRARGMVEVEHRAFADVNEEADVLLAPGEDTLVREIWQGKGSSD